MDKPTEKTNIIDRIYWSDIRFLAVVTKQESHWIEFEVYDVLGEEEAPVKGRLLFQKDGEPCTCPTESLEESEVYLEGSVKWDGCSNWYFKEQDRVMLHGCSREDLIRLGEVMARCWDYASENLETWNGR